MSVNAQSSRASELGFVRCRFANPQWDSAGEIYNHGNIFVKRGELSTTTAATQNTSKQSSHHSPTAHPTPITPKRAKKHDRLCTPRARNLRSAHRSIRSGTTFQMDVAEGSDKDAMH